MIELKEKNLDDNDISDITPRAGLTKLEEVNLGGNDFADASPLVGLTSLTYVNLEDNPLNQAPIDKHIPAIEATAACVDFELPHLPVDSTETLWLMWKILCLLLLNSGMPDRTQPISMDTRSSTYWTASW